MNFLGKLNDLNAGLEYLQRTRPLILIPSFLSNLTYEQNRARTRSLSGQVHLASAGGMVFTGSWTDGSRNALVAPSFSQTRVERREGAVPSILEDWLGLFETDSYFFRPEREPFLLFVTRRGPSQECSVEEHFIRLPNRRAFIIDAAYGYPGFFSAWGLKAGVESGDPRVWEWVL